MPHLDSKHTHILLDRSLPPAIRIRPGEEVTFETLDACWGRVRSVADFEAYRKSGQKSNPLTGPVYVEGAVPGGGLTVDILRIELDQTGYQLIGPNRAIIKDEVKDWECFVVRIDDDRIVLPGGFVLPVDPVVGMVGVAPAGEPTNRPGPWGGNLDVPEIRTGVRVHLPVEVEGALFSLGDVHARQGDGELVGAPEIGARVTARLDVRAKPLSPYVMIETAETWSLAVTASTEAEAARHAGLAMGRFVAAQYRLRFSDAMVLLTMTARVTCARTGTWGDHGPVVCVSVLKSLIEGAVESA